MIDRVAQYAALVEEFVLMSRMRLALFQSGRLSVDEFIAELERDVAALETAFGIQPASTKSHR